jgi:hypothetical protein
MLITAELLVTHFKVAELAFHAILAFIDEMIANFLFKYHIVATFIRTFKFNESTESLQVISKICKRNSVIQIAFN